MALYDTLYGVTALVFAAMIPFVWREFGAAYGALHAAEPVRAALVRRLRGAGPLLLGAVSRRSSGSRRSDRGLSITSLVVVFALFYTLGLALFTTVHPLF